MDGQKQIRPLEPIRPFALDTVAAAIRVRRGTDLAQFANRLLVAERLRLLQQAEYATA